MLENDCLLLDISLYTPQWSVAVDKRWDHSSYGPSRRRFIANGIARRIGESVESIVERFVDRVHFEEACGDIAATRAINWIDTQTGSLLGTIRRYDWDSFLRWLSTESALQFVFKEAIYFGGAIGRGEILASKCTTHTG